MSEAIRVVVSGAAGRMGEAVCDAVTEAEGLELAGRADPALDAPLADSLDGADVMVDFTTPEAAPANVREAIESGVHAVVGSTGFDLDELRSVVAEAGGEARCFVAPNFAIGAVLMMQAAELIAPHMPEAEIVELHHERKLDAPSGTAKRTAELISAAGGAVHDPIHSVRLPGLVAHQEVIFGGRGRRCRSATTRSTAAASCPGSCSRYGGWRTCPTGSRSAWRHCSDERRPRSHGRDRPREAGPRRRGEPARARRRRDRALRARKPRDQRSHPHVLRARPRAG